MTNAKLTLSLVSFVAALGLGGCEAEPEAPANPTWARDVQPILIAQCGHCHGGAAVCDEELTPGCKPRSTRYDIYNVADYGLGDGFEAGSTGNIADTILQYVETKDDKMVMPPKPAERLSDREILILRRWARQAQGEEKWAAKGTHRRNFPPVARLVEKRLRSGVLNVVFDISDDNGDQVLGRATPAGQPPQLLERSGRHTVRVQGGTVETLVEVVISDGWGQAYQFDF